MQCSPISTALQNNTVRNTIGEHKETYMVVTLKITVRSIGHYVSTMVSAHCKYLGCTQNIFYHCFVFTLGSKLFWPQGQGFNIVTLYLAFVIDKFGPLSRMMK